ncbi:hypothetical protein GCM10010372_62170 [Streptomyces tauricus]|nr:hypothetical protein GCM10010372_62170 [Streptomyces tauricus]
MVGRDREHPDPENEIRRTAPAVQWIKARCRAAHPINGPCDLGIQEPNRFNRAGLRTGWWRLLHMAPGVIHISATRDGT